MTSYEFLRVLLNTNSRFICRGYQVIPGNHWFQGITDSQIFEKELNLMWFWNQWFQGITGSRESLVPHIWECYRWVFRLCKPFFINWICFLAWKYLKPCAERPLEMVCYISWKLWNQWFPGTSDPLEPLVPKPHEFPLKNLGISDSLESVVPRNHLIPSADEMTVSFTISWTISFCEKWGKILWNCSVPICMSEIIEFYQTDYILKVNKSNTQE